MGSRVGMLAQRRRVPRWWFSAGGVVVAGVCLATALVVATSHPEQHRDRLSAAVVNNDEPVTVDGQITPLGRQLAAKILGAKDTFDWSLMTTQTAEAKLKEGEIVAVVTIPEDFSAKAASMATDTPANARPAIVHVRTSESSGVSDSAVTEVVTRAALEAFNGELREAYLDNVYLGLSKMRKEFGRIASGARKLADGAGELGDGTDRAASGGEELVVGLKELASGAVSLADGIEQLASGVRGVHAGTTTLAGNASQLTSATRGVAAGAETLGAGLRAEEAGIRDLGAGASQLASGLAQLRQQTASLPGQSQQLAAGAESNAAGASQLADGATDLASGTAGVSSGASELASGLAQHSAQMAALAAASPGDPGLQQAAAAAAQLAQSAAELAAGAEQAAGGAEGVSQGAAQLSLGAGQLSAGVSQLASGTPFLAGGVSELSGGAEALSAGLGELSAGAGEISGGATQLASGSSRLAAGIALFSAGVSELDSGVGQLATGADEAAAGATALSGGMSQAADGGSTLSGGLRKLADGTAELSEGAGTFAGKLEDGAQDMPDYSKSDRDALKKTVSSPAGLLQSAPAQTRLQVFFALLAVWLVALGVFGFRPPLPHRLVESTRSTWQLALDGAAPSVFAGALTGVLASIVLWFGLGLDPARALMLCLLLALAGVACGFVNHALIALLSGWGAVLSLVLAIALGVCAFFSAVPRVCADLFSVTPLGGAWNAALHLAADGSPGLVSLLVVVGWGLAAMGVALAIVSARRMTSGIALRRARHRGAFAER